MQRWRDMLERCTALRTHHQLLCLHLKNICSDWNCECAPNRVNVFERGLMLPGCFKVRLAVITLCWLKLCIARGFLVAAIDVWWGYINVARQGDVILFEALMLLLILNPLVPASVHCVDINAFEDTPGSLKGQSECANYGDSSVGRCAYCKK